MTAWRQLRAIGPLPGMVTVVIPAIVVSLGGTNVGWDLPTPVSLLPPVLGAVLVTSGLLLMHRTISLFATVGEGTLAPWDPTRRLVVRGPYRHVRNPMISGVFAILAGEVALLGSVPLLLWLLAFSAVNATFIPLFEEPDLERRFGEEYATYKRGVPRWIPRRRPWT